MIKQVLVLPIIHYLVIVLFLFIYVIKEFKKGNPKKNFLFTLFCLILLLIAIKVSPSLNSHYLLDSFHSDAILLKNQEINISVDLDDLFQGEYGVFSKNENIVDEICNLKKEAFLELLFYKDNKQQLKLKLCKVKNKDEYSFNINGDLFVLVYNGNIIKFNPIFYDNLDKIIRKEN